MEREEGTRTHTANSGLNFPVLFFLGTLREKREREDPNASTPFNFISSELNSPAACHSCLLVGWAGKEGGNAFDRGERNEKSKRFGVDSVRKSMAVSTSVFMFNY